MKSGYALLSCLLILPLVLLCCSPAAGAKSDWNPLVRDNSAFALDLYHKLAETETNTNLSRRSSVRFPDQGEKPR